MQKQLHFSFLLIMIFLLFPLNQSSAQDCEQATAQIDLDVNNVKARLLAGGDLWWDGDDGQYIVPQPEAGEPEVSAIFAGGLWLGGFDSGGNLKVAAQTYGTANGNTDYWPGPLSVDATTTPDDCVNFDRFWVANSTDIDAHKADWNDNGTIDGPIPQSIIAWPGRGNPNFQSIHGFELPFTDQGLAPFHDKNTNGIYDPENGDYPNIKDADKGIWWVFNDAGGVHSETGSFPLKFEIQVLAYAYSSNNDNINNATFYDYKIINRVLEQLDSTFVGLWVDPDLGCYIDDNVGCDTINNLAFIYNSDALDGESSCNDCSGVNTYCEEIPLVGIKILKGVTDLVYVEPWGTSERVDRGMSSFMYLNNGGGPSGGGPSGGLEYYRQMTATWPDGTPLTVGGDGYDPTSTNYTKYAFPSPPNDTEGWSLCAEGMFGNDRRIVIGSGPTRFDPGVVNTLSFVVLFVEDVPHPCPDISPLLEAAEDAQNLFDSFDPELSTEELGKTPANIQFQPNPMTQQAELIFNELENSVQQVTIYSIEGKLLRNYDSVFGKSLTIEKRELGQGMYFYKILTDDFKVYGGKFIVQ
jgi:hypothetical protein